MKNPLVRMLSSIGGRRERVFFRLTFFPNKLKFVSSQSIVVSRKPNFFSLIWDMKQFQLKTVPLAGESTINALYNKSIST